MDEIKLIVNQNYSSMMVDVFIMETTGVGVSLIGYDGKILVKQDVTSQNEMSQDFLPLFRIPLLQQNSYFKAFLEYASGKDIKTVDENLLQGKMDAMKEHLVDSKETLGKVLSMLDKFISKE